MNEKQIKDWRRAVNAAGIAPAAGVVSVDSSTVLAIESALREQVREVPEDPMDWPLPCDVKVGHGTIGKGCTLGTLVTRMKVLYEMATGNNADKVANRTEEERQALAEQFRAALAAPTQPAQAEQPQCWCQTCRPITLDDMRMVLCPDCGNKRCPKANDHRNACTGSNEPGQPGSAYPTIAQVSQPKAAQPSSDMTTWCEYVAGMACGWLGMPVDDQKIKGVAGIIERRLWAMPQPKAAQQEPMTRAQINKASGDAQIAFCLDKQPTYEVALVREVERFHGITKKEQQ